MPQVKGLKELKLPVGNEIVEADMAAPYSGNTNAAISVCFLGRIDRAVGLQQTQTPQKTLQ